MLAVERRKVAGFRMYFGGGVSGLAYRLDVGEKGYIKDRNQ